jgi:hypothetical protein
LAKYKNKKSFDYLFWALTLRTLWALREIKSFFSRPLRSSTQGSQRKPEYSLKYEARIFLAIYLWGFNSATPAGSARGKDSFLPPASLEHAELTGKTEIIVKLQRAERLNIYLWVFSAYSAGSAREKVFVMIEGFLLPNKRIRSVLPTVPGTWGGRGIRRRTSRPRGNCPFPGP